MNATVSSLKPSERNLDNVPHMLRLWADLVERGVLPADTVVVLAVDRGCWEQPAVLIAGQNLSPLELAGVGQYVASRAQGRL